jgi:hypothetical protein
MVARAVVLVSILALLPASCSSGGRVDVETTTSPSPTGAASSFCRKLTALDARLRAVRSYSDETASVARYVEDVATLDLAYRAMRDLAPTELDLEPIEYANGRFGEIVRAMSPELDGASARAQVARILESYNAALFATLVAGCGPESVDA